MSAAIKFVTGNTKKVEEVEAAILGKGFPRSLQPVAVDLPEFQGEPEEIVRSKCRLAAERTRGPTLIEDTCLGFTALGGLPGPYIKWFLAQLGPGGLHKLLEGWEDKGAQAVCTLAFTEGPEQEIHLFKGVTEGSIVCPRGEGGFGWDPCFLPDGYDRTYGQMTKEEKNEISHMFKAVRAMEKFFVSKQ